MYPKKHISMLRSANIRREAAEAQGKPVDPAVNDAQLDAAFGLRVDLRQSGFFEMRLKFAHRARVYNDMLFDMDGLQVGISYDDLKGLLREFADRQRDKSLMALPAQQVNTIV